MRITRANNKAIEYACKRFHYAKSVPVNPLGYNVYNGNEEWCGVILYGYGSNNHIGSLYNLGQGEVLELTRVALNGKQECTSQAVAMTLKQLRKDCPMVRLIVSYADIDQAHLGTIYQATNWIYVGAKLLNQHDSSWIINGKRYHGRVVSNLVREKGGLNGLTREQFIHKFYDPKAQPFYTKGKRKYLMPMDKKMRKQIQHLAKPYPKTDAEWHKIDRNIFKSEKNDENKERENL